MKKYNIMFTGRQSGAIGITYQISDTYRAENLGQALYMLNTDYEHIRISRINENDKQIDREKIEKTELEACPVPPRERDPKTGLYKYTRSDTPLKGY